MVTCIFTLGADCSLDVMFTVVKRRFLHEWYEHFSPKRKICSFLTDFVVSKLPRSSSTGPTTVLRETEDVKCGESEFYALVSVSLSAQGGIVALGKAHTRSAPSLSSLSKVTLETVQIFAWLNTDRSERWRVECRPLPFSTPLSFLFPLCKYRWVKNQNH